ncbi:MAG: D-alanine--D-alanine ligase [Lachnospiraceae bacterium]|jgi:D-alanine-D-alanine ligase|nr:D-alanine--D-alanine ligase [Lachnospiraceae bacterium]
MNIAVLCGGISTEREISIVSGTGVCKALRTKGHRAVLVDVFCGDAKADLNDAFPENYDVDRAAADISAFNDKIEEMKADASRAFFGPNVLEICKASDIVFLALHGENGENGKVQAAFDLFRIQYTGTGHVGSAIAMDKGITKIMLRDANIPTPHGVMLKKESYLTDIEAYTMKFPVVVKPCNGGSSVGVRIVYTQEEYEKALKEAFRLEDEIVVEDYIKGREFSVSVIDGHALPVIEIAPIKGFYDYKNKYTPGSTIETCPANIPHKTAEMMQRYTEAGYRTLALDAYGRFDFMMNENGDVYCLEANTLPGMTPTSLMPQEAAQTGMDYPTLCEELIRVSMKKYSE